jgi:diguanylate cyclase (GGDEF)-like protein
LPARLWKRSFGAPGHRVSFLDRDLEVAFREATLSARKRHVIIEIVLLGLIALAVLPIDILEHQHWQAAVMLRLGVIVPAKALALYLAHTARTDRRLDIASALSFCVGFTVVVMLGLIAQPELQERYFSVLGAIALLYAAFSGQRTRGAGLTVGCVVVLFAIACYSLGPQVSRGMAIYAAFVAACSVVAIGVHLHVVERAARSFFLREQLLAARNAELSHRIGELDRLTKTDALTGLGNRRLMEEALAAALDRGLRHGRWVGVSIIDVDCFKAFNDTVGHLAGDACLKRIAACLAGCLAEARPDAGVTVARLGGEEFGLIVPDASPEAMLRIGEQARAAVEAMELAHPGRSDALSLVTISVGVSSVVPSPVLQAADLLRAADEALYESKSRGRNTVSGKPVWPAPAGQPVATERSGKRLAFAGDR